MKPCVYFEKRQIFLSKNAFIQKKRIEKFPDSIFDACLKADAARNSQTENTKTFFGIFMIILKFVQIFSMLPSRNQDIFLPCLLLRKNRIISQFHDKEYSACRH